MAKAMLAAGVDKGVTGADGSTREAASPSQAPRPTNADWTTAFPVGSRVEVRGLKSRPEWNGREGNVTTAWSAADGRCMVEFGGEVKKLKPENLVAVECEDLGE